MQQKWDGSLVVMFLAVHFRYTRASIILLLSVGPISLSALTSGSYAIILPLSVAIELCALVSAIIL
ncbi:hypothetical protein Tco_0398966, partial [Tanacetum coccineum]